MFEPRKLAQLLGDVSDSDPHYKAIIQIVYEQFADETLASFSNTLTIEERSSQAQRAAALYYLLQRLEAARVEAKEPKKKKLA